MTTSPPDLDPVFQPSPYAVNGFKKGIVRDREAARLAALGWDPQRIGEHLGLDTDPEHTEARVAAAIRRALAATHQFAASEARLLELAGLQELELYLWRLLSTEVVMVQHGRIVSINGKPMTDHRFGLEVVDRLRAVKAQKAKLMGWDAPTQTKIMTSDSVEEEIKRLEEEIERNAEREAIEQRFPEDTEAAG